MNIRDQLSEPLQLALWRELTVLWHQGRLKGDLHHLIIAAYHGAEIALRWANQQKGDSE